jgi:hypothetical protein
MHAAVGLALCGVVACSGDSGSTPSPDPSLNLTGTWSGTASDSSGSGQMTWQLTQSNSTVSGTATIDANGTGGRGSVTGTLSGSSLQFTLTFPAGSFDAPYAACATTVSGTSNASATVLSGTYTGSSTGSSECRAIGTGQFTLNKS